MKVAIILVSIFTLLKSQDVVVSKSGEKSGQIISVTEKNLIMVNKEGANLMLSIPSISSARLSDGTELVKNGKEMGLYADGKVEKVVKVAMGYNLSGLLIVASGLVALSNNNRTLGDNPTWEDIEDFADESKLYNNISSSLLIGGGLLMLSEK